MLILRVRISLVLMQISNFFKTLSKKVTPEDLVNREIEKRVKRMEEIMPELADIMKEARFKWEEAKGVIQKVKE